MPRTGPARLDRRGNLYCTGPGGIWVFSVGGSHLGTIRFPEVPANCHWGDPDARMLYVTARTGLYQICLSIQGVRPAAAGDGFGTAAAPRPL